MPTFLEAKYGPLTGVWWALVGMVVLTGVFGAMNALLGRRYMPEDGMVQGVVGRMGSGKSLFIVSRVLLPFCRAMSKRGYVLTASTQRRMTRVVTNFRFDSGLRNVEVVTVCPTEDTSIFSELIALAHRIGAEEGPWFDLDGVLRDGRDPIPDGVEPVVGAGGTIAYQRRPIINGLVVLDELHLYAGSGNIAVGEEASWLFSMARKLNAEIWWCSQHEMKVHKRIRDESSSIWLAAKLNGLVGFFVSGWHVAREYHSPQLVERARAAAGDKGAPRSDQRRFYRFSKRTKRFYNSFELLQADPPRSRRGPRVSGASRGGVAEGSGSPDSVAVTAGDVELDETLTDA